MKAWAKSFYLSAAWEKTRAAYLMSQDYICERCGQPAKIVHHKRWLNRENINDMDDVYQGENLTPVIREFEGIIKDGDFKIADNNLLKTHFLNVALKHNMETRKFRPIKIEQRAHIDGFVSVIDAMTVRQKYWEECGELLKNAA